MYLYTQMNEFKQSAYYWFNETLKLANHKNGLAGYKSHQNDDWVDEMNFLHGIAGIGLALISAISDIEPAWDECLLLS
jgi:hypothetical protein